MNRLLAPDRPDWRWARVADLSQYSTTAALARLQDDDALTRRAYEFRRALDRGFVPAEYREIEAAYDIFMNRPDMRMQVEGLLIAGADDETIAYQAFSPSKVIELYHELFFWVRPGLNRSAWLNSAVFGGLPQMNAHMGDLRGTVLRLAMKIGAHAFLEMISAGLSTDTTTQQLKAMVNEVLMTQVAMMSFSASRSHELPEWVGKLMDQKDSGQGAGNSDMDRAIDAFFDGLGISVADPTEQRNLELDAREERFGECEVVSHD